jgi:hypothetical protein
MKKLISKLKELPNNCGIIGIKQSFEDEGVLLRDVITMRRLTELCDLKLFIKIGGCEAKTDMYNCAQLGVDCVIAPMVETSFALNKFMGVLSDYNEQIPTAQIVIESKTAFLNIDEILKQINNRLIGIVVGRSDFCKSFGINKSSVDDDIINEKVEIILSKAKEYGLLTTLGGNISTHSVDFIQRMMSLNLLDRIETRNVVIDLTSSKDISIEKAIQNALDFEIEWLNYKYNTFAPLLNEYDKRIQILANRK